MCLSLNSIIPNPYPLDFPGCLVYSWEAPPSFLLKKLICEAAHLFPFSLTSKVETEDQLLAIFCGSENTDTEHTPGQEMILSPGSFMSITFQSDFSDEERFTGFDAHYMAVGKWKVGGSSPGLRFSLKIKSALYSLLYNEHLYTHHTDSIMNVLLHLLYHISIHLLTGDLEHLYTCLLAIYISFWGKCMFNFF